MNDSTRADSESGWLAAMPSVFVLIWSTGFIVARFGMPHAPPMRFLLARFVLSAVCFGVWVVLAKVRLPRSRKAWLHLGVTGVLMHSVYLGGVWSAVKGGLGAGTSALIVGLQPLLTALWMSSRSQQGSPNAVTSRQWAGLALGFLGMGLVVKNKLALGEGSLQVVMLAVLALMGITAGTLYQKRFVVPCDVRAANCVQLIFAAAVALPFAVVETGAVEWHPQLIGALAWSVLALTLGASSMLYLLIQRGAATRVTSLLYLVPPCTAVLAWLLFGEVITAWSVLGMVLTVLGVSLVTRPGRAVAWGAR